MGWGMDDGEVGLEKRRERGGKERKEREVLTPNKNLPLHHWNTEHSMDIGHFTGNSKIRSQQ